MNTKSLPLPWLAPVPRAPRAEVASPIRPAAASGDDEVRRSLLAVLAEQPWWDAAVSNVYVDNGTAFIQGLLTNVSTGRLARRLALAHPGVSAVRDQRRQTHQWLS